MDKDEHTQLVRERIQHEVPCAVETARADAGLTILSFQSGARGERHVWIDTDLDGDMVVDLEDWNFDGTWDNSVAHLSVPNEDLLIRSVSAWLSGSSLEEVLSMGGNRIPMV